MSVIEIIIISMLVVGIVAVLIVGAYCEMRDDIEENSPKKYDEIHDRRRKMNKRERIEQLEEQVENLEEQVENLERELKYVEHKNDKAKIETENHCTSCFCKEEDFYLIYPEHNNRKIEKIHLGLFMVGLTQTYANNVKILKETDNDIYIEFKNNVVPYDSIIKRVHRINGNVTEIDTKDFETLKELFETKPKKSNKKEK